jgi:phosphate/phosphite/phosphonate ABC transporter binding protein
LGALVAGAPDDGTPRRRPLASHRDDGRAEAPAVRWPAHLREVRFGVTPYLDEQSVQTALAPVLEVLSERIEVPVRLVVAESYAELGQMMRQQEIDLAKFSPLSYVEAKEADPDMEILLTQVASGSTSYLGYLYVRADDEAEELGDLAGRSFCYVDPQSTSGYLYPRALLRSRGLDPDEMFSRTVFGGNHLACLEQVLDGTVDAGAAFSGALAAARRRGLEVFRLKILGKTARIPYDAYCARSGLPPAAAGRLKQELLRLSTRTPDGQRLIGGAGRFNAWTEASDGDYDSVRQALALTRQLAPDR